MDNLKTCKDCKKSLPLNSFNKRKVAKDGLQHVCKLCNKVYKTKWHADIKKSDSINPKYVSYLVSIYKTRSKIKGYEFDLDTDHLIQQWDDQYGKCFYTRQKLQITEGYANFWTASLDRLNPKDGYIKGNVVWTLRGVNCFKQELTLEEFLTFVNSVQWRKS